MCEDGSEDYQFCREFEDLIDTLDVCDADDLTDLSIEADIPMMCPQWERANEPVRLR